MKKHIIKIFTALVVSSSLLGCSDFLTQVNPNKISTDSYWRNLTDCESGMVAVYSQFRNQNIMGVADESNRADLTYPGYGRPNTTNENYLQTFTDASTGANNKWDALYKGIFYTNQVIVGLNNIKSTLTSDVEQEQWTTIMAQARFFRGLFHFYLHSSFNEGKVIIYDFVPETENDFLQPLSTSAEVIDFFRKDLEYAYKNLPANWPDIKDNGRATAGAAGAVLGTSYLYERDYEKAKVYFADVISNYGYRLVEPQYNSTTAGELNQESILEVVYSLGFKPEENTYSAKATHNTLNLVFSPVGGWRSVLPSCWLTMAYKKDSIDTTDPRNTITNLDKTTRLRKYSLRTSYSLALVDDQDVPYYGTTCAKATLFNVSETAYFRKYTNWDIYGAKGELESSPVKRSGINYRVIRLADVYLMMAECLIEGGTNEGGVRQALDLINAVRERSALLLYGMPNESAFPAADHDDLTYTADMVMQKLMYVERPLELACEGYAIRQIDLRRWGITKQRFQELSQRSYYPSNYSFIDDKGTTITRWESVLQEGVNPVATGKTFVDFTQAAQNYTYKDHAYWPIPNSERLANPKL